MSAEIIPFPIRTRIKAREALERPRPALAAATQRAAQLLGLVLYGVLYVDPPWDCAPQWPKA